MILYISTHVVPIYYLSNPFYYFPKLAMSLLNISLTTLGYY